MIKKRSLKIASKVAEIAMEEYNRLLPIAEKMDEQVDPYSRELRSSAMLHHSIQSLRGHLELLLHAMGPDDIAVYQWESAIELSIGDLSRSPFVREKTSNLAQEFVNSIKTKLMTVIDANTDNSEAN
ncbi:hypothetical protein GF354_01000 [Candidatus Peregrinibacteria bacterium]|nr:hypothetical protein [Candidatus Peregrinibacteria bacterium]